MWQELNEMEKEYIKNYYSKNGKMGLVLFRIFQIIGCKQLITGIMGLSYLKEDPELLVPTIFYILIGIIVIFVFQKLINNSVKYNLNHLSKNNTRKIDTVVLDKRVRSVRSSNNRHSSHTYYEILVSVEMRGKVMERWIPLSYDSLYDEIIVGENVTVVADDYKNSFAAKIFNFGGM